MVTKDHGYLEEQMPMLPCTCEDKNTP